MNISPRLRFSLIISAIFVGVFAFGYSSLANTVSEEVKKCEERAEDQSWWCYRLLKQGTTDFDGVKYDEVPDFKPQFDANQEFSITNASEDDLFIPARTEKEFASFAKAKNGTDVTICKKDKALDEIITLAQDTNYEVAIGGCLSCNRFTGSGFPLCIESVICDPATQDCIYSPEVPSECDEFGELCFDGSIYIDANTFLTAEDQGSYTWSTQYEDTNVDSYSNGQSNHYWITTEHNLADYQAFQVCENLILHGHSDWYLPARNELRDLFINPNKALFNFASSYYWTSTEYVDSPNHTQAWVSNTSGSSQTSRKTDTGNVRCIRSNTPLETSSTNTSSTSTNEAEPEDTVTTASNCPNVGDICSDGSLFAGDTNMYVTDADQSLYVKWSNERVDTGADSASDGQQNQQWIIDNKTLSTYPAFKLCANLNQHGHNDWYLPAKDELLILHQNRSSIGGMSYAYYWASTEANDLGAYRQFTNGTQTTGNKSNYSYPVRCVRRR